MRRWCTALAVVSLASGCGVPLQDLEAQLDNTCSAQSDCAEGGTCRDGMCVSTRASLTGLLLQVDLPTQADYGAGTSSLVAPAEQGVALHGRSDGGFVVSYDITIPELVDITNVRLQVSPVPSGCIAADDESLPVSVQLHPAEEPVGLPLTVYSGKSSQVERDGQQIYECGLQVPAGTYDIYVALDRDPTDPADPNQHCDLPPVVLTGHELVSSTVTVDVLATESEPVELTGSISGLNETLHLTDWTIELVENKNGRPISTDWVFEKRSGLGLSGDFRVSYWPESADEAVIRLSPPDGADAMPTVLWLLDAVDLDGDNHVGLDLTALATAAPVALGGNVLADAAGTGVGATVTIQSQELLGGEFGANAAYRTTADAGTNGHFDVSLLPGTYKVIAQPGSVPDRAVTEDTWTISKDDLGEGKTIELKPKTDMIGSVHAANGNAAFDVPAYLQPSATPALPYLDDVLSTYDVLPTNATALTDGAGAFAIKVDPGAFDLSVRPSESSRYPWLVRARVTIQPSDEPSTADLGDLTLSNPVVVSGTVRSPQGAALSGAQIRAWIPVEDEQGATTHPTVIQIAEALSDGNGRYTLYLPPSISQ